MKSEQMGVNSPFVGDYFPPRTDAYEQVFTAAVPVGIHHEEGTCQ